MKSIDAVEALKNIFIFRGLGLEKIESLSESLVPISLKKGETLFWEDDDPDALYMLHTGKIKLIKQSESGKETILGIISPGETIGEIALFDGRPFPFSAQAMEKSVVMKMHKADFLHFLLGSPNACVEIIIELSRRLRDAQDVIKGMAADRVEHRIIELLLKLSEKVGRRDPDGMRIGIVLTRQDIADMVGSTVETTIRVLSRLTKQELIETRGKTVIIKDREALEDIINMEADW